MRWVAPTEKDIANQTLEKRLWAAADQFRANSGLKAGEYSGPVLGLIFRVSASPASANTPRRRSTSSSTRSSRGSTC
jgi:type I restriction enzyme M protein